MISYEFFHHLPFSASYYPYILFLAFLQDQWWREEGEVKNLGAKVYRTFQNSVSYFTQK